MDFAQSCPRPVLPLHEVFGRALAARARARALAAAAAAAQHAACRAATASIVLRRIVPAGPATSVARLAVVLGCLAQARGLTAAPCARASAGEFEAAESLARCRVALRVARALVAEGYRVAAALGAVEGPQ